jgi:hypothetical protein
MISRTIIIMFFSLEESIASSRFYSATQQRETLSPLSI